LCAAPKKARQEEDMTEPEVFVLADQALNRVVAQIKPEQWAQPVPEDFSRRDPSKRPSLREVVNYHAYEDAWVPDMLAGRTMDEVGKEKYKGDLLGDDPVGNFGKLVERACAAARAVTDLERPVHTSFGDFPTRGYLWQTNMFRGLRTHDIARAIGVDPRLPADLVQGLWDEVTPNAEEWRKIGVLPAAIPVPADAPLLDRLLGLTGRRP
jgi:uncharacterized protein (TIGR03086 family)